MSRALDPFRCNRSASEKWRGISRNETRSQSTTTRLREFVISRSVAVTGLLPTRPPIGSIQTKRKQAACCNRVDREIEQSGSSLAEHLSLTGMETFESSAESRERTILTTDI